ncbi:uncharacterized protein TNCV_3718461 [Trichonephila clavipes]|nr:uncharacterized protein TNCV_3718461 [Trichonephila clavipes]
MGTRLRALKLKLKGKKLEDKKSLGGRNRLTDAEIDKLQRYYGLAIRNNSGNLSAMKQAIWAIFFHKISTDLNPQHGLCPLGDDSWCGYNRVQTERQEDDLADDPSNPSYGSATRGLLATDHVILNHGQVTWTTPELAPPLLTTTPHQREDVSALDRFNVHRCPTRLNIAEIGTDHAHIRKAENAISQRTKQARIKNRLLKCRQEDDLADDPSNPSYGSECIS